MKLKIINLNELIADTLKFIEANRNWSVEKQAYKNPAAENCKAELSECEIYQRGNYIIVQHDGIVHFWEHAQTNYPYLKIAIYYMEPDRSKKWKTLDKLIALRMGIRQTEANCCGYVEDVLEGKTMTLDRYNDFMALARAQDLAHHGAHTF